MVGQTNDWMDMQYMCKDMKKNNHFPIDFAIFTKALRTDGQTNQRTDKPSYRDAIAAYKKISYFIRITSFLIDLY